MNDEKSEQPQATHTTRTTNTEQVTYGPPPPSPDVVSFQWGGKTVAVAVLLAGLLGSFFTFSAAQWGGISRSDQSVHDRLDSLEAWRVQMTAIADRNTEARIKTEQQLDQLKAGQEDIKVLLREHMGRKNTRLQAE